MSDLLEKLNPEQQAAVTHGEGPLLIVAGAGTGKTTVITRRLAYLLEKKLAKPEEILALTFTEKAAGEMQERADLLLPLGHYDMWISTFHGFCERLLKLHALDIGLPNDFKLLDETAAWILVYRNFERFQLDYYRPLGNPAKFIGALLTHFSKCKDEMISPEEYLTHAQDLRLQLDQPKKTKKSKQAETGIDVTEISRIEEIANAYHSYEQLLLENNFLDFGDLINYCLQLLQKRPKILDYYRNKFKFLMVDEFQDTNYAQYQLVRLLAGDKQNLAVVGDDDQSIYKFRGASVSNILKFKKDYPKLKQITLVENYRSSQNILDLAYTFIQANNPDRLEVNLGINKRLQAKGPAGEGVIQVVEGADLSGELNAVAKKILERKVSRNLSWNDIAVLIRSNSAADALLPVLASHAIPFTFVANKGLYKKPVVLDILSYLKFLDNANDSSSLYRVLSLPKFHLSHTELSDLLLWSKKKTESFYESLAQAALMPEISSESKKRIGELLDLSKKHHAMLKTHSAAELLVDIIKDLGFEEKLREDTLENAQSRELLEQFYKKIEDFQEKENDHSLHNFLSLLELEQEAGDEGVVPFDPNQGPESVKVLTIHAAKGLEFETVFLINLVDQRFPTREKGDPIEIPGALVKDILPEGEFHLQEERRLFYVGLTRAKTELFLTWAKDYGGQRAKKPSQFLVETGLVPSEKVSKATGKVVFTKNEKLPVVYRRLPEQFSYSQLNDFEACPLKYKYQHYLKLPVPGSQYLSFGQTIHKVLEEYLKLYKTSLEIKQMDLFGKGKDNHTQLPEFSVLEKFYEKFWVDDWYGSKQQKLRYKAEGHKILKTFFAEAAKQPFLPKYIEQFFKLKLGKYDFVGKIDRADQAGEGVLILDYKTGKVPKSKKDLDQLYIYQWAAKEFLQEKVVGLKYWYLQENAFVEEELAQPEEIEELKARLLALIEKIVYVTRHDLFKQEHQKLRDHNCQFESLE
ncbi:MAG: ATP-dependent helicase [Patescibacteria group bacterium]|nr:ATP-dependent helicase [Patescibacteria group bacterium]